MSRVWLGVAVALCATGCGGNNVVPPAQQSNAVERDVAQDAKLTQLVRRKILNDPALSTEARNLYIRTNQGVVTLRGAVDSDAERDKLRRMVQETLGTSRVNDETNVLSPDQMSLLTSGTNGDIAAQQGTSVE